MPQATDAKSQRASVRPSTAATTDYNSQHSTASTARGAANHSASSFRTSSSNGAGKEARPQNCSPSAGASCGPSESAGSGRPRNPVGRPSKHQLRLRQAEQAAAAAATSRKRRASPDRDDSPRPERNSAPPPHPGQGRPPALASGRTAPSPHGPINGSLSPGHKPRPPAEPRSPSPGLFKRGPPPVRHSPDPASRGRGAEPGVHGLHHKGLGRKCRGGGPSPQKIHRLPSPPPSGFFSWKKDGAGSLEKKLSAQKVGSLGGRPPVSERPGSNTHLFWIQILVRLSLPRGAGGTVCTFCFLRVFPSFQCTRRAR